MLIWMKNAQRVAEQLPERLRCSLPQLRECWQAGSVQCKHSLVFCQMSRRHGACAANEAGPGRAR